MIPGAPDPLEGGDCSSDSTAIREWRLAMAGSFGLGAYHGIHPGWAGSFAVALGMQNKSRRAVLSALPPYCAGARSVHCDRSWTAVGRGSKLAWQGFTLRRRGALFGFGLYRLLRSRHPAWVGMRVNFRDLTLWSFLMASAHGAGLMLVPIMLGRSHATSGESNQHLEHMSHANHMDQLFQPSTAQFGSSLRWLAAIGVHGLGYLLVMALIALVVYEKFGLALLRRAG